jgi:hypothetical protein
MRPNESSPGWIRTSNARTTLVVRELGLRLETGTSVQSERTMVVREHLADTQLRPFHLTALLDEHAQYDSTDAARSVRRIPDDDRDGVMAERCITDRDPIISVDNLDDVQLPSVDEVLVHPRHDLEVEGFVGAFGVAKDVWIAVPTQCVLEVIRQPHQSKPDVGLRDDPNHTMSSTSRPACRRIPRNSPLPIVRPEWTGTLVDRPLGWRRRT